MSRALLFSFCTFFGFEVPSGRNNAVLERTAILGQTRGVFEHLLLSEQLGPENLVFLPELIRTLVVTILTSLVIIVMIFTITLVAIVALIISLFFIEVR